MAAHQATFEQGDSELWYVATGPGETKLLTLEQLDDLFRLEIIDANTRLWQPGMREWLPLSVVAGLDEPAHAAPPPPSARVPRAPAPPPFVRPVAAAPTHVRPAPAPAPLPMRTAPLPAPSPLPMSTSSLPPGRPVPVSLATNNVWPPPASPLGRTWPVAAPASAAPVRSAFPPPESIRPLAISTPPAFQPRGSGGFGRFVLMLAVVAGAVVTLYRNDVLRRAAVSAGLEKNYVKLESALGGPGFGTPRAVSNLLTTASTTPASNFASTTSSTTSRSFGSTSSDAASGSLGTATSLPSTGSTTPSSTATAGSPTTSSPSSASTGSSGSSSSTTSSASAASREEPKPTKPAVESPHEASSKKTLAASMAASIGGSRSKPAAPARAAAPSRKAAPSNDSPPPSKGLGFNGGKGAYDPLNGNL